VENIATDEQRSSSLLIVKLSSANIAPVLIARHGMQCLTGPLDRYEIIHARNRTLPDLRYEVQRRSVFARFVGSVAFAGFSPILMSFLDADGSSLFFSLHHNYSWSPLRFSRLGCSQLAEPR
jgi:hypothetical protein